MNDFTASNGITLLLTQDGRVTLPHWTFVVSEQVQQALREFFQAEADERLGRWRVPGHQNWVCYPTPRAYEVVVFNEDEPHYGTQLLICGTDTWPYYRAAADAYFDAHPEPKPWHDAQPGEVWVLETRSDLGVDKRAWHITDRPESFWALAQGYLLVKSNAIVSGRRIWPEVQS